MRKQQAIIASLFLLLAILGLQLGFTPQHLTILPTTKGLRIVSYSDSSVIEDNRGNSTVAIDSITDEGLYFHHTLGKQFGYYYAGVQIHLPEMVDVSEYSHVAITLSQKGAKTARLFILTSDTKVTDPEWTSTMRHLKHVINLSDIRHTYTLPLSNFSTPQWWFETNKIDETEVDTMPFKKVVGIKIESGEGEPIDLRRDVHFESITFFTPIPIAVRTLQATMGVLILLLLAFRFGIIGRVKLGKYTPVVLGNVFDEDLEKITNFIGNNYQRHDLALHHIEKECFMQGDKIAALIKQGYGQTFKQYLNRLRLTEAQRLLRSTDRQVSEIAHAVGYNNPTHFNRVFKQMFSCTPREFRS